LKACGGFWPCMGFLVFMLLSTGVQAYNSWFLGDWTDDTWGKSQNFYVGIYSAISLFGILMTGVMMLFCCYMSVRASRVLHARSFERVIRAPMAFFDTTPIGRILNRFSRDQALIDSQAMRMIQNCISMVASLVSIVIVIALVTPWILIPFAIVLIAYAQVERAFRNSNRELKRIEAIARSPLYAHFGETLVSLPTIRAYRAQGVFLRAHLDRLDSANSPTYLQLMAQRWLAIRVETISAAVAFFSSLLVVLQRDSISAGSAGVAVSYAISLPLSLNWLVRCTAEVESGMNSVERAKYYSDELPQEAPTEQPADERMKKALPPLADGATAPASTKFVWSGEGAIVFDKVRMRYRPGLPEVLRGVSFSIKARERIGIVGRTGSGKSSLMAVLFRLVELERGTGGSVRIDGADISELGLDFLRSSMAIIAQDPVLFTGSIRSNLDPFRTASDAEVWQVLERAQLAATIRALPGQLDEPVSEGGESLSLGQRCLLAMARAMLRVQHGARILVMDEATASVDMATDELIQLSLRRDFGDRTLLTIAHRLHTVIDYDRVCVMADGEVQELDTPANLLRNPHSAFRKLVDETGPANARLLTQLALDAERGLKLTPQMVHSMALQAPGAADAGLSSPSSLHQPPPLGSGAVAATGSDEADAEISLLRWHAAPDDVEPDAAIAVTAGLADALAREE